MSRRRKDATALTPEQIEAAKAARARWAREYRANNPEKNKEAVARYWARRAAQGK